MLPILWLLLDFNISTCHPATAAWDYARLQRLGASDEVAWRLGVVHIMMALQSVKREWSTALMES